VPSGELRLHLLRANSNHPFQTWTDSAKRPLEDRISATLLAFLDEAIDIKARREEHRLAEIENRRKEELRWRQSQRRSSNAKLIHQLEAQAGAWHRAQLLKSYLRALKQAIGGRTVEAKLDEKTVDFLLWAEHYANQLDPLSTTPHEPDLMDEDLNRHGTEDNIRQTLSRLMGRHWQQTWKLADD